MREERRTVTALFADIAGSTALTERLDPEDARELLGGIVALVIGVVEEFGGTVKDLAGDGVVALFGAPSAHEDDAERAVRSGLAAVAGCRTYAEEVGRGFGVPDVAIRVGIETGLAVVGPVGAGGRVEYGVTGDAINTAARLQSATEPGTVMVGPDTRRLVEPDFEWGPPRTLSLKGKSEPVVASVALGARRAGRGSRAGPARTELVGREDELLTLRALLDEVRAGAPAVAAIVGDAGLGKSRLVAELRSLLDEGSVWVEGHCSSFGWAIPFLPFRDLLLGWLGLPPASTGAEIGDALRSREAGGSDSEEHAALLARIAGGPGAADDGSDLDRLSAEALQHRMFGAVCHLVASLAERSPVAVVLEDLHWADPTSVQLAERLIRTLPRRPILVVLTLRKDEGRAGGLVELVGSGVVGSSAVVELAALPTETDRAMLRGIVGEGVLPDDLELRLIDACEGNPFFLEELVGWLRDAGALVLGRDGWQFDHRVPFEVPGTVEKVVLSRIDRLSATARDTLDAASVLGRTFPTALLAAVGGEELVEPLGELRGSGLVVASSPGASRLEFRHSLVQETAYRSLLRRRRRELHARTAAVLETMPGPAPPGFQALLARHRRGGGHLDGALTAYRLAAAESRGVFAMAESAAHLTSALETAEELGLGTADPVVGELLLDRGRVLAQTGDAAGAGRDFEAAARSAHDAGDVALEAKAIGERGFTLAGSSSYEVGLPDLLRALDLATEAGDRSEQVAALGRLSIAHVNLLRLDLALDEARRAGELAARLGDPRAEALALDAAKQTAAQLGDLPTLERTAADVSRRNEASGDRWYLQFSLFEPFVCGWATGDWEDATARVRAGLAVNEEIEDRGNRPLFVGALCELERCAGRLGSSLRLGTEAAALATELGHGEWICWTECALGTALMEAGSVEPAIGHLERAVAAGRAASARLHLIRALAALASAEVVRGRLEGGADLAGEVETLLAEITVPPGGAWLFGWPAVTDVGLALVGLGRPERAREVVGTLLGPAEAGGWWTAASRARLVLGSALEAEGSAGAAAVLFREAAEGAERAGMPLTECRARIALARVAGSDEDARRARRIAASVASTLEDGAARAAFLAGVGDGSGGRGRAPDQGGGGDT
jgi:class 3 adenylate cyclase/tetratricopeptide (TPR) repeat protein